MPPGCVVVVVEELLDGGTAAAVGVVEVLVQEKHPVVATHAPRLINTMIARWLKRFMDPISCKRAATSRANHCQ
ncbi:MAG: hypothetical protein ACREP6_11340 [Candidatus Binataceae bacterium]